MPKMAVTPSRSRISTSASAARTRLVVMRKLPLQVANLTINPLELAIERGLDGSGPQQHYLADRVLRFDQGLADTLAQDVAFGPFYHARLYQHNHRLGRPCRVFVGDCYRVALTPTRCCYSHLFQVIGIIIAPADDKYFLLSTGDE